MKYSWDFIETIAIWLNYGSVDKSNMRKLQKMNIPDKFKLCNQPIYRVASIKDNVLKMGPRSWSLSVNVAKEFAHSAWFSEYTRPRTVVLNINNPINNNVVLNINDIFHDQEFLDAIKYYESIAPKKNKFFDEGLGFGDSQKEIIYNINNNDKIYIIYELNNNRWNKCNIKVNIK